MIVEKGLPNQANYISECYPAIPLGENSVMKYQRQMKEALNRRMNSMDIANSVSHSPVKGAHKHVDERHHKKHHRHRHSEQFNGKKIKVHARETDRARGMKLKSSPIKRSFV